MHIKLVGAFRLLGDDGRDLTPPGLKNRALLAMLALSPDKSRPRRWIESRLWSTFGPDQASASLRQALSKTRSALAADHEVLQADRLQIWLDPDRVTVDLFDEGIRPDTPEDLLFGMDIRDPVFSEWIDEVRQKSVGAEPQVDSKRAPGLRIGIALRPNDDPHLQLESEILANRLGESLSEHVRSWCIAPRPDGSVQSGLADADLTIDARMVNRNGGHQAFVQVVHAPTARVLFSRLQPVSDSSNREAEDGVHQLIAEATDRVLAAIPKVLVPDRPEVLATNFARQGIQRTFHFERDALREAADLFRQAHATDPNGLYLAWLGMVRLTQYIERSETDLDVIQEEALALVTKALEMDEGNPMVMAIAAKVRSTILGAHQESLTLARNASRASPSNPFAMVALAEVLALSGQRADALELSRRARNIAQGMPFAFWWDIATCVMATGCRELDTAFAAGEAAMRSAPNSRPTLRHLMAIHAERGQHDEAMRFASRLREVEPDFTIDRMISDDRYPVRTLRQSGLLEALRPLL